MAQASWQPLNDSTNEINLPTLLDPALLQAARQIYQTYCTVHPERMQRPLGVAISRYTYRGQLIFQGKPILLPQECFLPLNQIEPELY